MKKIIVPLISSLLIGSFLGLIIFKQYKSTSESVFLEATTIYFLQQGVYSSKENMEKYTANLDSYIYTIEDNQYKVFVSINTIKDNASKIKEIYNNKGIDIYIKEGKIEDKAFIEKLKQYDELIKVSDDEDTTMEIVKQILSEYELVVKENQ